MSAATGQVSRGAAPRASRRSLARADAARLVLVPVLSALIVYFLCVASGSRQPAGPGPELARIALVQKDAAWHPLPPRPGAPAGSVVYTTRGTPFRFGLRASSLEPGVRYVVELIVDGTPSDVADRVASAAGEVTLDTTLRVFDNGLCPRDGRQPPRALGGTHRIKFELKRSGSSSRRVGALAQCAGNGDVTTVLFEEKVAAYEGGG